ncbi:enoyl-CoA hydratase/isomerase family protein [Oceanobacillus longus]|uniref:Enoyl-CoA hydratase/isomerase family protein n=1 Tax=Oceanobacillus longus TaxID=930120 RepID=A0ABV8GUS7_9BACI
MEKYETLKLEKENDVLTVTLNREKNANAVNTKMIRELIKVADWLREAPEIKFVVFTNQGKIFSAGADLYELYDGLSGVEQTSDQLRSMQILGQEMMRKLESIEQITISALRGSAYGAGVAILMTTDFRIMEESAILNLPETNVGIFLTWGCTPRLVKAVGAVRAKELIMLCEDVTAEESYSMGFINRVAAAENIDDEIQQYVEKIRSKGNQSIRMTKKLIQATTAVNFGDIMIGETELVEKVLVSGETKNKMKDFVEREK